MNQLDLAILAVIALGAIYGLLRGVLRMASSIVALAAGIYLASIYYPQVAAFAQTLFGLGATASATLGYIVVFLLVFVVVAGLGEAISRILQIARLGWIDRVCGAAAGVAVGGALMGLFLMILTAMLPVDAALLRESKLAPAVLSYAETLIAYIPEELKDSYRAKRDELWRLWFQREPVASPTPSPKPR